MSWIRLFLLLLLPGTLYSQPTDTAMVLRKKPLRVAAITSGAIYAGGLAGLNYLWYKDSERQSFRFFNDNAEWNQVDKIGHFYSSFYLSYGSSKGLKYYGVSPSKADITGAIIGFAVLVPIEVFDGFSDAYGASVGDLTADAAGSLFYLGQVRLWNEVRIKPKFSFHTTKYSNMRPELLGEGMERIMKDYNGQTYWLSLDADKFVKFPKWLNIAVGYGANGMVYARDEQHEANNLPAPFRQYYLSLDFDASAIKSRSKLVNTLLFLADMIKIPAPTLEYSDRRFRLHALYF